MVPLSIALIQRFFGIREALGAWRVAGLGNRLRRRGGAARHRPDLGSRWVGRASAACWCPPSVMPSGPDHPTPPARPRFHRPACGQLGRSQHHIGDARRAGISDRPAFGEGRRIDRGARNRLHRHSHAVDVLSGSRCRCLARFGNHLHQSGGGDVARRAGAATNASASAGSPRLRSSCRIVARHARQAARSKAAAANGGQRE